MTLFANSSLWRRALIILAALVGAWLVACCFLFLWPHQDSVTHANAVVVLAGDAGHRIPRGLQLVQDGVAKELVISRDPGQSWDRWLPLCRERSVVCFSARPYSTQGEAETVGRLAASRGWRSIVVVSSRYHIFRARILFRRCVKAHVAAVGASYDRRWLPVLLPLETLKLVWAMTLDRHC